jgi:acyl-CoA thioesterase-1
MTVSKGYGRFAVVVNSLFLLFFCPVVTAHAQNPPQSAPVKIAMLGDSLTAGYGVHPEEAIPAQLEKALKAEGRNVTVLNAGVSGDTAAGGLDRVDWMMGDKPDIVFIELGANDALRGVDPGTTERDLTEIIEKLKKAGVTIWLAGMMAPRNFGEEYVKGFDPIYKTLADKYELPLYPFILDGVAQNPALNQADGMHPNPEGVKVIVKNLLPFVNKNLDLHASVHRPARP